jgi:hypothetical protein
MIPSRLGLLNILHGWGVLANFGLREGSMKFDMQDEE